VYGGNVVNDFIVHALAKSYPNMDLDTPTRLRFILLEDDIADAELIQAQLATSELSILHPAGSGIGRLHLAGL
jgi:hypothetical protein